MSLGDGIFWGAMIVATVALYLGTKDRWRWKRIVLWTVGGLLGLAAVAGAGVYGYTMWEERPQVITAYWGIKLGATPSEVLFLKGPPTEQTSEQSCFYKTEKIGVTVEFDDKKVVTVTALGDRTYLPDIGNISTYLTMEQLTSRLGKPDAVTTSADGEYRVLNYLKYNLAAAYNRSGMVMVAMSATGKPIEFSIVWDEGTPPVSSGASAAK
jgi:hypothetical protein